MPYFSRQSQAKLITCHDFLQEIFDRAIVKGPDHTILCGHREEEEQNLAFEQGKSRFKWPNSSHNMLPSLAVDAAPYPIIWPQIDLLKLSEIKHFPSKLNILDKYISEIARFYVLAGYIIRTAHGLGCEIRWGGDWNRNWVYSDQKFNDLVHYELII